MNLSDLSIADLEDELHRRKLDASQGCSGVSAGWCAIHGACACADPDDKNDDDCPLHSEDSNHAATRLAALGIL